MYCTAQKWAVFSFWGNIPKLQYVQNRYNDIITARNTEGTFWGAHSKVQMIIVLWNGIIKPS